MTAICRPSAGASLLPNAKRINGNARDRWSPQNAGCRLIDRGFGRCYLSGTVENRRRRGWRLYAAGPLGSHAVAFRFYANGFSRVVPRVLVARSHGATPQAPAVGRPHESSQDRDGSPRSMPWRPAAATCGNRKIRDCNTILGGEADGSKRLLTEAGRPGRAFGRLSPIERPIVLEQSSCFFSPLGGL